MTQYIVAKCVLAGVLLCLACTLALIHYVRREQKSFPADNLGPVKCNGRGSHSCICDLCEKQRREIMPPESSSEVSGTG